MPDYVKKIRTTDDSTEHRLVGSVIPVSPESFGMKAGAALTEGMIVFKSTETGSSYVNKIYPITNTSKYVDLNWGLAVVKKACASGTILNGDYIAQQGVYTYSSATAGRAYGIMLSYDGTGYKMASSTLSTLIVNMSTVTDGYFIYIGIGQVSGTNKIIACDFSNHMFFRFKNNRVVEINGRDVDTLHPSVPVSPDSVGITTGAAITAGDIIFRCKTDNKVYPITNTTNYLDLDWGLAIAKEACNANSLLSGNSILQQGPITYASAVHGSVYYIRLTKDSTGYKIYSNTPVTVTETSGHYIYLGHGIVHNGAGSIACDFSNHMFLTLNHGKVTHINGREIESSGEIVIPVAVNATQPFIGEDLNDNLVYKCVTDGKLYELNGQNISSKAIDMDWGIAYFKGSIDYDPNTDTSPNANTLLHKEEFSGLTPYLPSGANYDVGETLFLICASQNPTPRGVTGVYPKGIICSYDDVKSYATNYSTIVHYMYVGTYTEDGFLALDVTNHVFYGMEYPDFKIKSINGIDITQPTIPPTDYRNPVVGDSLLPLAYNTIAANSLVFKGTDGKLRAVSLTNRSEKVDPDWGLAIYIGSSGVVADTRPDNNKLMQQCQWNGGGADLTSFAAGDQIYAVFDASNHDSDGIMYPLVSETGLILTNRAGLVTLADGGSLIYCYIGTLIVNNNTKTIAVDLSAHQFITEDFSQNKITDINGVAVGSDIKAYNSTSGITNGRFTYYFQIKKIAVPGPGIYRSWLNINLYNFKPYPIEVYLYNYAVFVDPNSNTVGNNPTEKKIINIPPYTCYNACMESILRVSPDMIEDNPTYVLGYGYRYEVSEQKHVYVIGELPEKHITVDIPYSISIGASNYYVRDELQDMVLNSTQYYGWTKYNNKNNHVWTTVLPALTASGIGTVYYYSKTGSQLGMVDIARYETKNIYERYQDGDYKIDKEGQEKIWYAWKCLSRPTYSDDTYGLYNFQYLIYTESETPSSTESSYVSGQRRYTVYQGAYDNYGNYLCGRVLDYKQEPNEAPFSQYGIIRIGDYDANINAGGGGGGFDSVVDVWENN